MSFVFYDTETTGTDTSFDQILQFAAIRTDTDLNEIERFDIRCRLMPHIVPSPGAMRVTGVSVAQLLDPQLPSHYEMMRAIHTKLASWSPAIFIGHNSMSFDEHLLRQALYQTLHPVYLTNTNGNCRSDSLRMVQAVSYFAPNTLSVPIDDRGRPSFKLDRLAPANGFADHDAHDAMGDVLAMIHVCRLIMERADGHWSSFLRFAQKAAVDAFLQGEEFVTLADFYYGKPYSWFVAPLGLNPENGAELLAFDLANDPSELSCLDDAALSARLARSPKPVRGIRMNAAPIIQSFDETPPHIRLGKPDEMTSRQRAAALKANPALSQRFLQAYLSMREPVEASPHLEQQIYGGFTGNADLSALERFHAAPWAARPDILPNLGDARLRALGQRLIYIEAPEVLSAADRARFDVALARRVMAEEGSVPWLTIPKAIIDTQDMLSVSDGPEKELLAGLYAYLRAQADSYSALVA